LAVWLTGVVVLGVLIPVSGAGIASSGAQRGDRKPAPGVKPNTKPPDSCTKRAQPGGRAIVQSFVGGPSPNGDVCGGFQNDSLTVNDKGGPGTQIWGGPGDDVINAKNSMVDEIWGDSGHNKATIDWCLPDGKVHDTVHNVPNPKKVKVTCHNVKQSGKHASAAAITYPYAEPLIDCTVTANGEWRVAGAHEPLVHAVDATPNVDWQTVAFSALLDQWNASESSWDLIQQSPWVWDRAPDEQLEGFPANFWLPFNKRLHENLAFTPPASGKYRVSIDYHWYAANGVPEHDTVVPAAFHFDHFASPNLGECDFPGTPPPDGKYTGKTDDGNDISFLTGAIWPSATRAVGGTRLTTVQIRSSVSCTPVGITSYGIAFVPTRWIQLNYDNTFAYAASSPISSAASTSGRTNATATYSITGKVDLSTATGTPVATWTGTVAIWQLSFDLSGTHYSCTGKPHVWTAKLAS